MMYLKLNEKLEKYVNYYQSVNIKIHKYGNIFRILFEYRNNQT